MSYFPPEPPRASVPGRLDVVVAWPDEGAPETRLAIPIDGIIEAICRVTPVWDQ